LSIEHCVADLARRAAPDQTARAGLQHPVQPSADTITICDLEVFFRVGVPEAERARPQRLLLTVELTRDFTSAAATEDLGATIDYSAVAQRLQQFGEGRCWKLIETLAADVAEAILREFKPDAVTVEVKKFVLPQTRHVAVRTSREKIAAPPPSR
jgi:dihydroneopterin aldolase